MNQEQNNLNPNNFNTQDNNGISNNQGMNFNQQPINPQQQLTPSYQQPIMQEPTPQPMNTFESGNVSNQSFNSEPPKKMNLGLIIGIVVAVVVIIIIILVALNVFRNEKNSNINDSDISENNQPNIEDKRLVDFGKIYYNEINNTLIPYEYVIKDGLYIRKTDVSKNTWEYEIKQEEVQALLGTNEFRKITDVFVYNNYLYFIAKKGDYFLNGTLETQYFLRKNISSGELQLLKEFKGSCSNFVAANEHIIFAVVDNNDRNKVYYYSFNLNDYTIKKIHDVKQNVSFLVNVKSYVLPVFIGDKVLFIYNNDYVYLSDLNAKKIDEKAYALTTSRLLDTDNYQEVNQEINDNILKIKLKYINGRQVTYKNIELNMITGDAVSY